MLFLSLFVFGYSPYYQNDMGGSSLGMGGAPIGLNNSVECVLYNPAAFACTEKLNVFTGYKLTRGEEKYSVMIGDHLFEDTFRLDYAFPDYLGVALPFGKDYFFSLSLSVPYRSVFKIPIIFTVIDESVPEGFGAIPGEYIKSERLYSLNAVMGKAVNDKFSFGVNMGVFWKRSSLSSESDDPELGEFVDDATTMDKYGIEPCLGMQYKASNLLSFGLLLKKGFGSDEMFSIENDEGLPLVLGFGTGINLKDKIYINVSGEYIRWTMAYSESYLDSDDYRNVVRLHLGAHYQLNDLLSLSTGFYTEPSPIKIGPAFDPGSWDQMFVTGGVGLDFGRVALNFSAASSALIKKDPALREENHFNLSVSYK